MKARHVVYIDTININCENIEYSESVKGLVFLTIGTTTISSFLLDHYSLTLDFVSDETGVTFWKLERRTK